MSAWAIWLIVAGVVAAAETASGDFFLLMIAGGGLAAAVAAALGAALWLQVLVFGLVSILMVLGVRPIAKRVLAKGFPDHQDGVQALIGTQAVVSQAVDTHGGRIKLDGNEWSALTMSPHTVFEVGTKVRVVEIRGAHAVITNDF